jgi:hypothetical protein
MRRFLSIVITVFVFVVFAFVPVVPISIAPVVPNSTYSFRLVALFKILWFALARPDGVSYKVHWYTFAVILVLLAIGCLVTVLVFRKIGGSSNN